MPTIKTSLHDKTLTDYKTTSDKDGNLTSYSMSGKTHTASYNSQNQLTKYDDLSYTYDADGNRVSAGDVKFIYDDNGHLLSDGTNTYVYGASGVVGYYNKDGKFITYLFNQRGDVVKETDESGLVINSFDYNDYGKLIGSDKAVDSVFGYGGQYGAVTDKNGLVFLQTRYYNPEIMRFMNRDTVRGSITDTKSLNRFAYVEGNPLTYVDPNGQAATWLKNNPLDALYDGLMGLSFVPGLNIVASIGMMTIDLAKGDYTSLAMDSLGILIPGAAVGLKLGYDGVRAVVDALKISEKFVGFSAKLGNSISIIVDTSRAIKSGIQVGGAKAALRAINSINNAGAKFVSKSEFSPALAGISNGFDVGPVEQKLQTFVERAGESHFERIERRTVLKASATYENAHGYKYATDELRRISDVDAKELVKEAAKRNGYAQRIVGGSDRLSTDDGGHLIASMFGGSGNIDNLVAQARSVNRSGGDWYALEQRWFKALDDGKSVSVHIHINYSGESLRPDSFEVTHVIDGVEDFSKILN